MRNFKKRTLALVLASVVTVAGSFAADRFKNSLMGIVFETAESGITNMIVQTKIPYSGNLVPIKRDVDTYILTLPGMDNKAPAPNLVNNPFVRSVDIRTMPYTNNNNGYTRITIKTNNLQTLPVQQRVFLPDSKYGQEIERQKEIEYKRQQEEFLYKKLEAQKELESQKNQQNHIKNEYVQQENRNRQKAQEILNNKSNFSSKTGESFETEKIKKTKQIDKYSEQTIPENNNELFLLAMGILLIILTSIYLYMKAKDKVAELSGETMEIDIKDEKPAKKINDKKINKIKNTIKTLDSTYSKSAVLQTGKSIIQAQEITKKSKKAELGGEPEVVNIVDLDKLFLDKVKSQNDEESSDEVENQALEDFLSGFSFDEEFYLEEQAEKEAYDVELFEKIIKGEIKFSKDDIECMNQLMQTEINNDTIKNIKNYLVSNPIKQESKTRVLEDIVATYAISQNIIFTKEDTDTIYKLINLEIDKDFVTDLRINPLRTKEVQKEILESKNKIRKPSEILTLKVSDSLPNLSEALQKQGKEKVKSDYKPKVVYYSEEYEAPTLSVNPGLPDLSNEVYNNKLNTSKDSDEIMLVDNSYDVSTLSISSDLPDLSKMQNYEDQEEKEEKIIKVDERTMLENIANVEFKPFSDNSQDYEVLNDLDDFYAVDDSDPNDVLSFDEIAAEFEELYAIKITSEKDTDEIEKNNLEERQLDLEVENNIIEQELVNASTSLEAAKADIVEEQAKNINQEISTDYNLEEKVQFKRERSKISESVLNKIQEKRAQRQIKTLLKKENIHQKHKKENEKKEQQIKICVIENISYDVLSSVSFDSNMGCHLTKNSKGYFVIGYIGDKLIQIKSYETLKSEKIQARISEKLANGFSRYIVRIGINKFILDISDNDIKFIMDLC